MLIGVFSEIHLHNHLQFSQVKGMGLNSRAINCLKILKQITNIAKEKRLGAILFCGDFFETRDNIFTPLAFAAFRLLQKMAKVCPVVMIAGNHDQSNSLDNAPTSVEMFSNIPNVHVLKNGAHFNLPGIDVVGYQADEELNTMHKLDLNKTNILLLHVMVEGAVIHGSYKSEQGIHLNDLRDYVRHNGFDYCFVGDIHYRQELDKGIWHVGSAIQKTFNEEGQDKGMLLIDSETSNISFIPLDSPKFITIRSGEKLKLNDTDYFRIENDNQGSYEAALELGYRWNVRVQPPPKDFTKDRESTITLQSSIEDNIEQYTSKNVENSTDRLRLTKLGKELVS